MNVTVDLSFIRIGECLCCRIEQRRALFARVINDLFHIVETRGLSKLADNCGSSNGRPPGEYSLLQRGLDCQLEGLEPAEQGCELVD